MNVPKEVADLLRGRPQPGHHEQAFPIVRLDDGCYPTWRCWRVPERDVAPGDMAVLAVIGSQRTRANLARTTKATLIATGATSAYYLELRLVRSIEEEGAMGCFFEGVDFKEDSVGIPLNAMGFEATDDIARMERLTKRLDSGALDSGKGGSPAFMTDIESRKKQDMELAVVPAAKADGGQCGRIVHLIPASLPEVSIADIDLSIVFLGHSLRAPLVIAGMTGGHQDALEINRMPCQAGAEIGIVIGTGSQRAALADPNLSPTFAVIREEAPDSLAIGNIGMCQLVPQTKMPAFGPDEIQAAVAMVGADYWPFISTQSRNC